MLSHCSHMLTSHSFIHGLYKITGDSQIRRRECLHCFTEASHGTRTVSMASLEPDTAQECLYGFTGNSQPRRQDCFHGLTGVRYGTKNVFIASLKPATASGLSSWLPWGQIRHQKGFHCFTEASHGARTVLMASLEGDHSCSKFTWWAGCSNIGQPSGARQT